MNMLIMNMAITYGYWLLLFFDKIILMENDICQLQYIFSLYEGCKNN